MQPRHVVRTLRDSQFRSRSRVFSRGSPALHARPPGRFLLLLVAVLAAAAAGAARAQPVIQPLGALPGASQSMPYAVSGDGSVVVGVSERLWDGEAFRWTEAGGMVGLGDLPGGVFDSEAYGVSANGSVVVGWGVSAWGQEAFRWEDVNHNGQPDPGEMVGLGALPGSFEPWSIAEAVSADGSVLVGRSPSAVAYPEAFRWTQGGGMVGLGTPWPHGCESGANGVSANGAVVVGYALGAEYPEPFGQAFRWTAGGMVGLGAPPDWIDTAALAVSADGSVIVGYGRNGVGAPVALRWTAAGGWQTLNFAFAYDVSADGNVVVGTWGDHAYIWTPTGGSRALEWVLVNEYGVDLTGWDLTVASAVSADGLTIAGWGMRGGINDQGFVVNLCPDRDGDGLCDEWEEWGIDVNGDDVINEADGDFDLPTRGANPDHKDIFVEIDAMLGREPDPAALIDVRNRFAAVPNALVNNPDGQPGIRLHLELDETGLPVIDWPDAWAGFDAFKAARFGTASERAHANHEAILRAKGRFYRYCVFANTNGGRAWSGRAELPGNDFMVTLGHADWATLRATRPFYQARWNDVVAGTFMHELGHTLGLRHGGGDHVQYKPNYHSIMNYTWQIPSERYPASWTLDYSQTPFPDLDETNLREPNGIGGHIGHQVPIGPPDPATGRYTDIVNESGWVDWNGNTAQDPWNPADPIVRDINDLFSADDAQDPPVLGVLRGYADWPNLYFRRNQNWTDGVHVAVGGSDADLEEITPEIVAALGGFDLGAAPGDMNCDGVVNFADINPFVLALSGEEGYYAQYPNCNWYNADCNNDGAVSFADINPFVAILGGG